MKIKNTLIFRSKLFLKNMKDFLNFYLSTFRQHAARHILKFKSLLQIFLLQIQIFLLQIVS